MAPKIKVCGLTNRENILEVLGLQPDYIGFVFHEPSRRFIGKLDPEWVSTLKGVKKTGVFVNRSLEEVSAAITAYGFQVVQLHGGESPVYCRALRGYGVEIIKAFGVDATHDWSAVLAYEDVVDYYLFDTRSAQYGGTGVAFDWKLLADYPSAKPYFLSGGLHHENIEEAIQLQDNRIYALDLNSRFETAPGIKDIESLKKTFQLIAR